MEEVGLQGEEHGQRGIAGFHAAVHLAGQDEEEASRRGEARQMFASIA